MLSYLCWRRLIYPAPNSRLCRSRQLRDASLRDRIRDSLIEAGIEFSSLTTISCALSVYVDGLDELNPRKYNETCLELNTLNAEAQRFNSQFLVDRGLTKEALNTCVMFPLRLLVKSKIRILCPKWYVDAKGGPNANELIAHICSSNRLMEPCNKAAFARINVQCISTASKHRASSDCIV